MTRTTTQSNTETLSQHVQAPKHFVGTDSRRRRPKSHEPPSISASDTLLKLKRRGLLGARREARTERRSNELKIEADNTTRPVIGWRWRQARPHWLRVTACCRTLVSLSLSAPRAHVDNLPLSPSGALAGHLSFSGCGRRWDQLFCLADGGGPVPHRGGLTDTLRRSLVQKCQFYGFGVNFGSPEGLMPAHVRPWYALVAKSVLARLRVSANQNRICELRFKLWLVVCMKFRYDGITKIRLRFALVKPNQSLTWSANILPKLCYHCSPGPSWEPNLIYSIAYVQLDISTIFWEGGSRFEAPENKSARVAQVGFVSGVCAGSANPSRLTRSCQRLVYARRSRCRHV